VNAGVTWHCPADCRINPIATIGCIECDAPCTMVDEPPPRTGTATAFWCDAHTPDEPPEGWTRLRWEDTDVGQLQADVNAHNARVR